MPPAVVKTIRDVIFWQYAKLISKSAGLGVTETSARKFQMHCFKKLQSGEMTWSSTVREWLREHEKPNECIYCGNKTELTTEHILPRVCGGPDSPDNAIRICKTCNSKKGGKRLYEWFTRARKDEIPRIAEGKYLKLLYDLHEKKRTLDTHLSVLQEKICPHCDLKKRCFGEAVEGKLTVYCLEGMFCG